MTQAPRNNDLSCIFLWGFMGSGKSIIGKDLALKLGYDFFDLDECIEKNENLKVSEIFTLKGEEYFRKLEHKTLKEVSSKTRKIVVSAGGGTPCYFDNAEIMNKAGITVYLKVSPKILKNRLIFDEIQGRPLLMNFSWNEIMNLYQSRQKYYKTAQITVSNNHSIAKCLNSIMEQLDNL